MKKEKLIENKHLEYYRSQHQTTGCRITHLFGIPMIVFSIPLSVFNWQAALVLFIAGWILQFIGHYIFEKNSPVLISRERNFETFVAALIYAGDHWVDTFKSLKK